MKFLLWFFSALCTTSFALTSPFDPPSKTPLWGSFIVDVDDHATIYLNGRKVHHANWGSSRSGEVELKVGDTIVVHLANDVGPRHFLMLFATSDHERICSFKASDYRIITDLGVNSFRPEELERWPKHAKQLKPRKGLEKQVKNYSEFVWGDLDKTALACIVTPAMITVTPK